MKKVLSIVIYMFTLFANCQEKITTEVVSKQSIIADNFVGQDDFGYNYFIFNNVFSKVKADDNFQYKNVSLGKITKIDIQNPLKIIVFYQDFNTIVILDNQLNEIQKINFNANTDNLMVGAVGNALQNNLWVFNTNNQQIGLYNYLLNTVKYISNPIIGNLTYYQTNNNTFFWIDKENYGFSCDIFGKIIGLGKIPEFDRIQFISTMKIIFKKNNLIYYTDLINIGSNKLITINEKSIENFYFKDQNLAIFAPNEIIIYKLTLP